jgi:alkylated DNA repair dioxygenase AlkB
MLECQAAAEAVAEGALDGAPERTGALDVLAQHVMGVACGEAFGADALFDEVLRETPWREPADRPMYDRIVAVPRLIATCWEERPRVLDQAAHCLGRHYGRRLRSITANLYRDGSDSVAWHGDKVRLARSDTVVAILSLGSPRRLLLRPNGGGPSVGYELRGGDLLVMGGTCQTTWQHCVPKRASAGPRASVMFREPGVSRRSAQRGDRRHPSRGVVGWLPASAEGRRPDRRRPAGAGAVPGPT